MSETVLYDVPGTRARRRALIGTVIATLAALGPVARRLNDEGQCCMELWGPLVDPSHESFSAVWELIGKGLLATVIAAVLAISYSLVIGTLLGTARMLLGRLPRLPLVA